MAGPFLSTGQVTALNIIQQLGASFSIAGCIFIISTFCFCKSFHKPINRLVYYASFGNLLASIAFMMAGLYVDTPQSAGCQAQGFLLDMFVAADAFWTLAMAINVYLTFYFRFDAARLRKMEIPYLIFCYGIPFTPAFAYLFIKNAAGERVYGSAGIWCWITPKWDTLRIATFYGPVWGILAITLTIYLRSGSTIYKKHRQLRKFQGTGSGAVSSTNRGEGGTNMKTTEVTIISESVGKSETMEMQTLGGKATAHASGNPQQFRRQSMSMGAEVSKQPSTQAPTHATTVSAGAVPRPQRRIYHEVNNAAWQYTKCALLFFLVIVITWIPSSANRVYSYIHPGEISVTLQFMSATVLPLQGFWNAVIYAVTSAAACKQLFNQVKEMVLEKTGRDGGSSLRGRQERSLWARQDEPRCSRGIGNNFGTVRNNGADSETESMRELAKSVNGSDDGRSASIAVSRGGA